MSTGVICPFCVQFHGNIPPPCHQSTLSGTRCLLFFSILHNTLHNKHNVKNRRLEFGRCHPDNSPCAAASSPQHIMFPSSLHGPLHASFNSEWILQGTGLGGSVMKPGVCQTASARAGRQPLRTLNVGVTYSAAMEPWLDT